MNIPQDIQRAPESLPIENILPDLSEVFKSHRNVILSAEPGAGKTTRVPLALLKEEWLRRGKLIMLEPRRLAASRAAAYMAGLIGERVGGTVGYRIRGETRVGAGTKIEVVTEGILTRLLQDDPALPGTSLVIFDEFHERSIHADLGLALTLDVQRHLRDDLRVLVMSATLDRAGLAALLDDPAILRSEGRAFPVTTHYLQQPPGGQRDRIEQTTLSAILRALRDTKGDLLVFLPGQREIRRVAAMLEEQQLPADASVHMLFGEAAPDRQHAALTPAPSGKRKVILSTNIAETSITIDGVRVVIDSGLARMSRFDPRRGMSGLVTVPVSQASADQRRGRAGRQGPGICYRLWTEAAQMQLPNYSPPEILTADLAPLALELARWGSPEGEGLRFIDPPPAPHLSQARTLLSQLGALDGKKLTERGKAMARLPVHPRFADMLIRGKELGLGSLACDLAAMLEDRDLFRGDRDCDIDLHSRWHALRHGRTGDSGTKERVNAQAARLRSMIHIRERNEDEGRLGVLLALAYPDRVAKRRDPGSARYQLSGGTGAALPPGSMLSRHEYLAVGEVDGAGNDVRIQLAEPLGEDDIADAFADRIGEIEEIFWDENAKGVTARRVRRFGAIELGAIPFTPPHEQILPILLQGIAQMGLDSLHWSKNALSVRMRSEWLRSEGLAPHDWPDLSDEHLLSALAEWLAPYLNGVTRRTQIERLDMGEIIQAQFSRRQLQDLDRLAPTHLTVPTGSHIPLTYQAGAKPVLAVRLQEMFGQTETPAIGGGTRPVLLHLLSPAHRPLAVTQDLPSFWKNAYPDVRKDMRGRYPRHYWPENPLDAEPTKRIRRKS